VSGAVDEYGGEMHGLEYRLKTQESLSRKLDKEAKELGTTPQGATVRINDSVRYTAVFNERDYNMGVAGVQQRLADAGWTKYDEQFKNYWQPGQPYAGYNCVFANKAGFRFELQFHTPKSLATKGKSHKIYERARTLPKGSGRTALVQQMTQLWQGVPRPQGWQDLAGVNMAAAGG
jgi:hypothetical protein